MRRTVSSLSRLLSVSRPCIYRAISRLGFEKKGGGEFSLDEWEALKAELSVVSKNNKAKLANVDVLNAGRGVADASVGVVLDADVKISDIDISTLKERLIYAKQEYDYNRDLISKFQRETDCYYSVEGKTTMVTHNGTMAAIPSIVNNEKYVKLNIALSKLISDLEKTLDLVSDEGDDPFG